MQRKCQYAVDFLPHSLCPVATNVYGLLKHCILVFYYKTGLKQAQNTVHWVTRMVSSLQKQ